MLDYRFKACFDRHIFLREPRNQIPLQEESTLEQLRTFSQWLLIVPLVLALIFSIGQLALLLRADIQFTKTDSSLSAEYSPWEFIPVRSLREGIIDEIRNDFVEISGIGETYKAPLHEANRKWLDVLSSSNSIEMMPTIEPSISTPLSSFSD